MNFNKTHYEKFKNRPFSERTYFKYSPSLTHWWRMGKKLAKWSDLCEESLT